MSKRQITYHRILRLPPHEVDPVRIISAAYVQLRRWRSDELDVTDVERHRRIRLIITARDTILRHVLDGRMSKRRAGSLASRLTQSRSASSGIAGSRQRALGSPRQGPTLEEEFTDGVN